MRILILNHHFSQDITELIFFNKNIHEIKYISPGYFANVAKYIFPNRVFGSDLNVYYHQRFKNHRKKYRKKAIRLLFNLYKLYQFDIFISPSDTFFYIRDVIDACRLINVPFVVIQKELGVSPYYFDKHADQIKNTFPVKCDLMTTCSEDSKKFWVKAGATPESVSVLGQPRFDFYKRDENSTDKLLSCIKNNGKINVLFLSYDLDAYTEEMIDGKESEPWKQLHDETIEVLFEISKLDKFNIYIKPHPQYHGTYLKKLIEQIKLYPNITILPNSTDARSLITYNDIIIGFQTTALFEAMIVGKKIIYTFWTENVNVLKERLLKFHEFDDCISISRSNSELKSLLLNISRIIGGNDISNSQLKQRINRFENILGKSDGKSSIRVLERLNSLHSKFISTTTEKHIILRKRILKNKNHYLQKEIFFSKTNIFSLNILRFFTLIPFVGKKVKPYIKSSLNLETLRLEELLQSSKIELIGSTNFTILKFIKGLVFKKL